MDQLPFDGIPPTVCQIQPDFVTNNTAEIDSIASSANEEANADSK